MINYLSNVYLDKEDLMIGINGACDAVKLTLGAAGANAILQESYSPFHSVINDGKTIAERIQFTNPVQNMGANLVKEISSKSDKDSGDGTTTSCVLLQAILKEGMKLTESPMDIKRSLDECLPIINEAIDKQTKQIKPEEVGQVATIAAEDEKLGAIFQEIYTKIGKDGIVELDTHSLPEISYEITEGVRLRNCGFMYPYMTNDEVNGVKKGKVAIYKNPKVLISKEKITVEVVEKLLKALKSQEIKEVVIFCDEIEPKVMEGLAYMDIQGVFKALVIKAPTLWKDWLFEDFSKITGATIIDRNQGVSFKELGLHHFGTCEKITTTKEETVVRGIKDISQHIQNLKDIDTDDSKLRLSWLQTKTAILKLGANSESELSYLRYKAEDARNASYLAMKGGIVVGGGLCLFKVSDKMPDTIGGKILQNALREPSIQIVENAGGDKETYMEFVDNKGFDAKSGKVVDMWKAGIVDPALVVKNSIKNAISVAGTVLTAKIVITTLQK
jgi:chaperonin GroEL